MHSKFKLLLISLSLLKISLLSILLTACFSTEQSYTPSEISEPKGIQPSVIESPVSSAVNEEELSSLAKWEGTYMFSEIGHPNSLMVMEYEVIISNEGSYYSADLNIDGFQTMKRLLCDVATTGDNQVGLYFKSDHQDLPRERYKQGDLLLKLEKLGNGRIKVIWGEVQPMLIQNQGSYIPEEIQTK